MKTLFQVLSADLGASGAVVIGILLSLVVVSQHPKMILIVVGVWILSGAVWITSVVIRVLTKR